MGGTTRVPLPEAEIVAAELVYALGPACERLEPAGSIRRRKATIGDVELLAIPRFETRTEAGPGMFDEPREVEVNLLVRWIDDLVAGRVLTNHPTDPKRGERYSKLRHAASGLQVDVFTVLPPATWGVLMVIRTGPAEFSQRLVTEARRRGFHVTGGQLHRGGLSCGSIPCEVVDTPEESDFLEAIGLSWRPPDRREGWWR